MLCLAEPIGSEEAKVERIRRLFYFSILTELRREQGRGRATGVRVGELFESMDDIKVPPKPLASVESRGLQHARKSRSSAPHAGRQQPTHFSGLIWHIGHLNAPSSPNSGPIRLEALVLFF